MPDTDNDATLKMLDDALDDIFTALDDIENNLSDARQGVSAGCRAAALLRAQITGRTDAAPALNECETALLQLSVALGNLKQRMSEA